VDAGSLDAVITYLENPDSALGADPIAARNALLLASLAETVTELRQ
jgi:penicillin amidase